MLRILSAILLLLVITGCGGTSEARPDTVQPTASVEPAGETTPTTPSIASNLNGTWRAQEPPLTLTIDLDAEEVTSEFQGITETDTYTVLREEGKTIVLGTQSGGEVEVRFISDDVISWSLRDREMTLTREK